MLKFLKRLSFDGNHMGLLLLKSFADFLRRGKIRFQSALIQDQSVHGGGHALVRNVPVVPDLLEDALVTLEQLVDAFPTVLLSHLQCLQLCEGISEAIDSFAQKYAPA